MAEGYLVVAASLLSGVGGALGTAYFMFRGKKLELKSQEKEQLYQRVDDVEDREKRCQEDLFDLRTELQSLYLITDILAQQYPEADQEVRKVHERLKIRKRERAMAREAEGL